MRWRDDGHGCVALINSENILVAAYGPDPSKTGFFRGFAFDPITGHGTHEAHWPDDKNIKRDIELWFNADETFKTHAERTKDYNALMKDEAIVSDTDGSNAPG